MARFDAFAGPTYQAANFNADAQLCMNRYLEKDEGNGGKAQWMLMPSPGLRTFGSLPISAVSSGFAFQIGATERSFSIGKDGALYEIFADGSSVNRGPVAVSLVPGRIVANQTQLLILAGGKLYRYTLATNSLSAALTYSDASPIPPIADIGVSDGYGIASIANTNKFQICNILNFSTWDPGDVAQVLYFSDNIVSMIVDHRDIIFLGHKQSISYYDSGNADFPFTPLPASFMEDGSQAVLGAVRLDNTIYWVESDERGGLIAKKLAGYTPQRVSTHAIEQAWQKYSTTSDLVSYSFQIGGHSFWHIYFPTANKSWRFDAATQQWGEVAFLEPTTGAFTAHRSQCHWVAFGKHLVGDWNSGQIFEMSPNIYDDFGHPMRRVRRAPYIAREGVWMFGNWLEIECTTGFISLSSNSLSRPFLTLKASDNTLWRATMNDKGTLSVDVSPVGFQPDIVYLNDLNNTQYSWLIGVAPTGPTTGQLTAFQVPYNSGYPVILSMATKPGLLEGRMTVTDIGGTLGLLETFEGLPVVREPQLMIRFSKDGGNTWSNERRLTLGAVGEYAKRLRTFCIGAWWGTRGLIVEVSDAEPFPVMLTDAYIDATPEYTSTERLAVQMRKGA